jgi:hypothetical protein
MSHIQKRGPGRPKGTKNKPGAKAGRPRKDAMKTMGSNPDPPILLQDAGMSHILEVKSLFSWTFFSDLAPSAPSHDANSMPRSQLGHGGEHISISGLLAFVLMLPHFRR